MSSVDRRLPADHQLIDAVYLWRRHPWMLGYCAAATIGVGMLAVVLGFEPGPAIALGVAAAALAGAATTRYRVLVLTDRGVLSFAGSRLRQAATGEPETLGAAPKVSLVGNYMVFTDWLVGGERWSVPRSGQITMERLAGL